MKAFLIIVGILIVLGIVYLVYRSNKQAKIKAAAIQAGIPSNVSQVISESSNPAQAARSIGIPPSTADSIAAGDAVAVGFGITSVSTFKPNIPTPSGYLKYDHTGTFYSCKGTAVATGEKDKNGNPLYDCYIEVKTQ